MARERGTMDSKDSNKLKELRELVDFLKENGIAEFDMERTDLKVRIKFAGAAGSTAADLALAQQLAASASGSVSSLGAASAEQPSVPAEEKLHEVKSPIVGTFYGSPSPGAAHFRLSPAIGRRGQVICIVEAMKLMNEIESDVPAKSSSASPFPRPAGRIRPAAFRHPPAMKSSHLSIWINADLCYRLRHGFSRSENRRICALLVTDGLSTSVGSLLKGGTCFVRF